jgi:hypothetical protein
MPKFGTEETLPLGRPSLPSESESMRFRPTVSGSRLGRAINPETMLASMGILTLPRWNQALIRIAELRTFADLLSGTSAGEDRCWPNPDLPRCLLLRHWLLSGRYHR